MDMETKKLLEINDSLSRREHQKKVDAFLQEQAEYGEKLLNETFVGNILKENDYQIYNLAQATEDFRKVMKLDKINEIAGVYYTKEVGEDGKVHRKENIVSITKSNYYNAFSRKIWNNLSDAERIKALEWMLETENESRNLGIKGITYFPEKILFLENDDLGGYFSNQNNQLFLSLDRLHEPNAYLTLPMTLAHEIAHAKQAKFVKNFSLGTPASLYTLAQTELGQFDGIGVMLRFHLDEAQMYAFYRVSLAEKYAELEGLKAIHKHLKLNEKAFGFDQRANHEFVELKEQKLFGKVEHRFKEHLDGTEGIVSNEQIVLNGVSHELIKLNLLYNFYMEEISSFDISKKIEQREIDSLKAEYDRNAMTWQEYWDKSHVYRQQVDLMEEYIKEDEQKLEEIKKVFEYTLKNGKLPEDFDAETEFKPLNIIEEKQTKYSLPAWLHRDEDRHRKKIEKNKEEVKAKIEESLNE